jgi:phosphomannomutase/phosphoglucomutase
MANLEPTMFREYDLRGRVNELELNEKTVSIISRAYASMLRKRGITDAVVGYDLRTGSKEFAQVATEALLSSGINVIAIGQVLTPIMYAAQYYYKTKGGMMLTASHNPNGWLGFKLALGFSYTFGPAEMKELQELTISEAFGKGRGKLREENYTPIYTQDVVSRVKIKRPIKVVVNAGNGTAGPIAPPVLRKAGCQVFEFLTEPDLEFKHYFPNPSQEKMMHDTGKQTVKHRAQLGLAFDGDGDRLGVTDECGQVVWPDRYMILLSREILRTNPKASIVFDSKCSRALSDDIKAHGGKPVMWKTGHSYIKEKLHAIKAPLAGEMSGHIFFGPPVYYGFDDALFAALKLAELLSNSDKPFSDLIAETPTFFSTPTLQAHCADELKYNIVAEIAQSFKAEGYDVIMFDNDPRYGGRVEFKDGWGLLRASSNLPVLVMRCEATTKPRLDEITELFKRKLKKYPQVSDKWESG